MTAGAGVLALLDAARAELDTARAVADAAGDDLTAFAAVLALTAARSRLGALEDAAAAYATDHPDTQPVPVGAGTHQEAPHP